VAAARERGIVVTNTPDVLTEATANLTWALIMNVTRRIAEGDRLIRRHGWKGWALDFMLGSDLRGKQLGIVGMGRIGRAVSARAEVFGMRVARADTRGVAGDSIPVDRLLSTSDIVTLHCPLTPETHHLIDQPALARMKRTAYLINASRGPIVDEAALAWALKNRLIAGAALDVYEDEPNVHPELMTLENVVLVPHLGSATTETRNAMADLAVRNVISVLTGAGAITPIAG
jgi:glyoxylate reductase